MTRHSEMFQHWVETVVASHLCYKDAGVFALQAAVPAHAVPAIVDIIGFELRRVIDKPIDPVELDRAKNQLRSSLFMNLETKLIHLEDVGRQTQMLNRCVSAREMSERIAAVTAADIQRVTRQMVEGTEPTFVQLGSTEFVPDLGQLQQKFGIGRA